MLLIDFQLCQRQQKAQKRNLHENTKIECQKDIDRIPMNILSFIMELQEDEAARKTRVFQTINKYFYFIDLLLMFSSILFVFIYIKQPCAPVMFLIFAVLYLFQSLQHYMIRNFPNIDINKHHILYRRVIILIGLIDAGYLFENVMFWSRDESHPIYCVLCKQIGLGAWIGLLFVFHFLLIAAWFFTLINSYIQRRYYLLAIGGFEAEQQLNLERQRQLEQMMVRQPNYEIYQPHQPPKMDKYYKFEDVIEQQVEENYQCSICLMQGKELMSSKLVNAGCGHLYHQDCLKNWVKVNSVCPQCRQLIQQQPKQSQECKKQKLNKVNEQIDEEEDQPKIQNI